MRKKNIKKNKHINILNALHNTSPNQGIHCPQCMKKYECQKNIDKMMIWQSKKKKTNNAKFRGTLSWCGWISCSTLVLLLPLQRICWCLLLFIIRLREIINKLIDHMILFCFRWKGCIGFLYWCRCRICFLFFMLRLSLFLFIWFLGSFSFSGKLRGCRINLDVARNLFLLLNIKLQLYKETWKCRHWFSKVFLKGSLNNIVSFPYVPL